MSWKWPWGKKKRCNTCNNDLDENYAEIMLAYGNPPNTKSNQKQIHKVKICSECADELDKSKVDDDEQ